MDYDAFNFEEETDTELANYGSWSFVTVEGHSSNMVLRINSKSKKHDHTHNERLSDTGSSGSDSEDSNADENEPSTLIEAIEDRNKEITRLKRMNHNQKLQLNYFLKRGLINDTISTLGRTINLNIPEEYDAINFAMARFNKINNRKGRIIRTYEKLNFTENKIAHLVKKQENLLRKVTLDVLTSTAERNATLSDCDPSKTEHYISYVTQLDIFSKLLATTLSVKRELEIIKSYSKRLIIIEEERNSLVDHIYQLPVEQRLNGSYLLSVERDKAKLCMEMTNIRNDQKMLKEKISKLNHEEEFLKETAKELKTKSITFPEKSELMTITKEERQKVLNEIKDLKSENYKLNEKVQMQQDSINTYVDLEGRFMEMEGKCYALEKRVEVLTHQKHDIENELLKMHRLETENNELVHTNEVMRKKIAAHRMMEEEVIELRQKLRKMDAIKEERDILKGQAEEFRSMKHLYAAVIDKSPKLESSCVANPNESSFKEFCDKIVKIKDMEKEREQMKGHFEHLTKAVTQQDGQIKNLLGIIDRFGDYNVKKSIEPKPHVGELSFLNLAAKVQIKEPDKTNTKCTSKEALDSVFHPEQVQHSTKIIETGELLSKLNCHIENLEETTRGFCVGNAESSHTFESTERGDDDSNKRKEHKRPQSAPMEGPEILKLKDLCSNADGESCRPDVGARSKLKAFEAGDELSADLPESVGKHSRPSSGTHTSEHDLGEGTEVRHNFKKLYDKIFGDSEKEELE